MGDLFRHRDVGDPRDELYVLDVDERAPYLGLYFGCHNADEHCVVQLRPAAIDELLAVLNEWKTRQADAS